MKLHRCLLLAGFIVSMVFASIRYSMTDTVTRTWNQFGGSSSRNNVAQGNNIPIDFAPGIFDDSTGEWDKSNAKNIKWVANLGSQTYGNPVVADGKVFVGTNNGMGRLKR